LVTHSVDEAIYLADTVVMMENGPSATIGKVMTVDFPRPRERLAVFNDPRFADYRRECVEFLFSRGRGQAAG